MESAGQSDERVAPRYRLIASLVTESYRTTSAQARSNLSSVMTLSQAATKSRRNFSFASSLA
jgi:hypothetical protein